MPSKNGNNPATQAQLKAVEKALKADIQRLAKAVVTADAKADQKIETLRTEMGRGFNRVTSAIDSFLGRLETYARESVTISKTLDAHGEKLQDHDRRLATLESKR
ncbi:MAG: hypothetical protein ABII00_05570 [Elusimicrobiota bacterium]